MVETCPVCGASVSFMAHHPEADLYRCRTCSHPFTDLASVAKENYQNSYFDQDHQRWFEHPNTPLFARLAQLIPKGASVLDVGCGRGDFLRYLRSARPDLDLTGVDLFDNPETAGIRFYVGDFLALDFRRKFDCVVSLAVIEHVADIRGFVNRMRDLAVPGGTVAVMTLDESSLLYGLARIGRRVGVPVAFNRLYSAHHLHHFTGRSLRHLIERAGFDVHDHFTHNAPLEAIDIPVKRRSVERVFRAGMWLVVRVGEWTGKSYLQTIICRKPSALLPLAAIDVESSSASA